MELITTYKDYASTDSLQVRVRGIFKNLIVLGLSHTMSIDKTNHWIRLPYYHHVFDDEKKDFERQMKYLKNFGDFISIDQVCELVELNKPFKGRYFSVSVDDGYRCGYTNMMEITSSLGIPVIIYLPTDYIGLSEDNKEDAVKIKQNNPGNPKLQTFLNWQQCREMLQHQISFGSHTCSHVNLIQLTDEEIEQELLRSKQIIEFNLNEPCLHFACPWGKVNVNFNPEITTALSKKIGYKTFATTNRGKMINGSDLFQLKRDHLLAVWGNDYLKYFFGK